MTNRNEIHNTSENENNTGNQINTGRVLVAAGALAAVAVGSGAAALLTSGNSTDDNQLDAVEDVVVSDQSNVDGVRERVILTLNEPADLDFDDVDRTAEFVVPSAYTPGQECLWSAPPQPTAELDRGIGVQHGVHLAYFVAQFESDSMAAAAASSVSDCYRYYAARLAEDLGRSPGVSQLDRDQEFTIEGGMQLETRIASPSFNEPGPVGFSARNGSAVAVLLDLDNALDTFDGPSLASDLVLANS
ncbi:MAG: hypothetical protein HRT86_07050 [Ilumatobacteraceae bacterium]|nr:hypothetical protein [Ilumatobacteraceae bacterium]